MNFIIKITHVTYSIITFDLDPSRSKLDQKPLKIAKSSAEQQRPQSNKKDLESIISRSFLKFCQDNSL
jgi:hypothetical protein